MNNLLTFLSAIGTVISALFVFLTYKVYKKSLDTRLYVVSKIEKENNDINDFRYFLWHRESFKGLDFEGEGFPYIDHHHEKQKWNLYIHNNGELPATNVELKYRITIFKNHINYGDDLADVRDYSLEEYVFTDEVENIEYLPPGESYCVPLIFLEGKFPKATVEILDFRCDENKFIKNKSVIGSYEHPSRYALADGYDLLKFLGTDYIKRNSTKSS
ncbi:hypothetical protein PDN73_30085 [Bacillus cereus]|nr:hypothetical protein [Bacillus cereus]